MALEESTPITRRDQLAAALDEAETPPAETVVADAVVGETAEQKADRLRDKEGKFATPDKAVKKEPVDEKAQAQAPVQPAAQRPKPPSSWKKDYHAHWETLDPKLAEYINQRESEYARGVSTYKSEAEQARQLNEAIAPFIPALQQHGIQPAAWIRNLGNAHQTLVSAAPEQKVQMFAKLIGDYQIDPQALFNLLSNPQARMQAQYQPPQQIDIKAAIRTELEQERSASEVQTFLADVATKYPHYEQVKDDMVRLLQSGAAQDLASAYEKSIRLNDEIWQAEQERKRASAEADKAKQQAEAVAKARSKAISVKTATPSGNVTAKDAKDRRSQIAEAFDGLEGRV